MHGVVIVLRNGGGALVECDVVRIEEPLSAEFAERMPLEACLIHVTRPIVAVSHVFLQLLVGEEIMFVCKDFLVPRAEIAHLFMVDGAHMTVEVGPTEAGKVARRLWAVVAQ